MSTFKEQGIDSFPLCWPTGWKRSSSRKRSPFKTAFDKARKQLLNELKLLGCGDYNVVISTNIPLRKDGYPYSSHANPSDPGVAVYFKLSGKPMVFACDQYIAAVDNLYAITKSIEALRGIKRWGASDMMERSFTGFQALPAPKQKRPWHQVLGISPMANTTEIGAAWRSLMEKHHPDRGGDHEKAAEINQARDEALGAR